jgi:hypothetical protein
MRKRDHGWAARLKPVLPLVPLLALSSCVLVIGTSPTAVSDATILFVATDERGGAVASMRIIAIDVFGEWRDEGLTARDGSFSCGVPVGVTRVRAGVRVPSGFVLVGSEGWPHAVDVPAHGTVRVEIRLTALPG